jgi:8-oxo-dGTP pyrophosphatase MutT (NUDIX family)
VRAAGGVVGRLRADGELEVLLVHRPRYDDWSLPKGKLLAGEGEAEAAMREAEEETGLVCALGEELPGSAYTDSRGRPKTVRHWAMRPRRGTSAPRGEVDEIRWLPLEEALVTVCYERDREVPRAVRPDLFR